MTETILHAPATASVRLRHAGRATAVTLALIASADLLLFGHAPGISLAILVAAVALGIVVTASKPITRRSLLAAIALTVVAVLPLIEAPSLPGILCAMVALAVLSLALAHRLPARISTLPWKLFGFALLAPFRWIEDGTQALATRSGTGVGRAIIRQMLIWTVPTAFALAFVWLFSSANPVIETVLSRIDLWFLAQFADPSRIMLWVSIAVGTWPLLVPRLLQRRRFKTAAVAREPAAVERLLFGPAALLRSLIVFNAIFAVQTALDVTYLWGGVALPEGMSHADYAHRGAYPLIATALLAAAFVLAAMRPGGAGERNRVIRWLVYGWIAQNIMLCVSSILRLDLYVEVYSLTELRIAAGIWMGLVAVGLALILARIALRRNNTWLVATNCVALLATLYACAFVDFSAVIANFNVDHSVQMGGKGRQLDVGYLRELGPTALPALDRFIANRIDDPTLPPDGGNYDDFYGTAPIVRTDLVKAFRHRDMDWRAWSVRDWRLEQYLEPSDTIEVLPGSDNNSADVLR